MSKLTDDLQQANIKGLNPPQNWTHRAITEIRILNNKIEMLEENIESFNMYFDDKGIARKLADNEYSLSSRMELLLQKHRVEFVSAVAKLIQDMP